MAEQDAPSQSDLIELAVQQAMLSTYCIRVGKVLAYKEIGPKKAPVVDVQMAAKLVAAPENGGRAKSTDMAKLSNVPVAHFQAGNFTMSTQLEKGNFVILLVHDRELNTWSEGQGQTYEPGMPGLSHQATDAIALPFISPESFLPTFRPGPRELIIGDKTGKVCTIKLDSTAGQVDIEGATAVNVIAPAVTLGKTGLPFPIARVGVDFVLVPAGALGGPVPISPGPPPGGPPSMHTVKG